MPDKPVFRDFLDTDSQRSAIFDGVAAAARSKFPVANDQVTLELNDVGYEKPQHFSKKEQKQAILDRRNLDWPLHGTWTLKDNQTGGVIGQARKVVTRVPYLTHRGTFIFRGNEYTLSSQARLRPGVYARKKDNGELENHYNLIPGTGSSFRGFMEPATGEFKFRLGQANIPAYPVLKALGVTDAHMQAAWGPDIHKVNAAAGQGTNLDELYQKIAPSYIRKNQPDTIKGIQATFDRMQIDPEVAQHNLGKAHDRINGEVLTRSLEKLLHVHQGKEDSDDRDSQANQILMGPEDLFAERIKKDAGGATRNLLWKLTRHRDVSRIPSSALSRQVYSAMLASGLGSPGAEVNPLDLLDQRMRVTRMGEGGILSTDSVPMESRNVQPSQLGMIDPIKSPESLGAGVDMRLAMGTLKGPGNKLYRTVLNPRTGRNEIVSGPDLTRAVLAFPHEMEKSGKKVRAMVDGKIQYVDRKAVQYVLPSGSDMFTHTSNLVPGISGIKGGRLSMAGRMFSQALPLHTPEAPLVQSLAPDGETFESKFGRHVGAVHAEQPGQVVSVTPDDIHVKHADGTLKEYQLYNNFVLNQKTGLHNTPVVKPGDPVAPGQLLAHSNFTDKTGKTAVGANFRVAFLPIHGTFEDGITISQSAAKRLSSEHVYQHKLEPQENTTVHKHGFISLFPGKYNRSQVENIGDDGIIKPGTVVNEGDPLILAAGQKEPSKGMAVLRPGRKWDTDESQTWEHHAPGIVTDVANGPDGVKVVVKGFQEAREADKLANRHGAKGVISKILPDAQMPHDKDGNPFEIAVNPLGIISRINPNQLVETALAKIARKTGQPYQLPAFSDRHMIHYALGELRKHGMDELDEVYDPATNRRVKVFTGEQFFMKLHHTAESKIDSRDTGGYAADNTPARGSEGGSKRVGNLDMGALLSHGVPGVIRDIKLVRGQRNDDYWRRFRMGQPAPTPERPFVYDKFTHMLQAAGVNVDRQADGIHLKALTDRDVDRLAGDRELTAGDAISLKDRAPVKGGLFDLTLTGGHGGRQWSKISLAEPMVNPVFEEPVRRLLGLTQKGFEAALSAPHGPQDIQAKLARVNVEEEIARQRQIISSGKVSKRDAAVKLLRYLEASQRTGIHPRDFMLTRVPVLPPTFRPVTLMKGMEMTSDANLLYKELYEANQNLKQLKGDLGENVGSERLGVYNALKAVTGLGDPVGIKLQEKNVAGMLTHLFGKSSPKTGLVQRKLLSTPVDTVGRGVISPEPSLDMDQVGVPENMAWNLYRPFIMRRLARKYNTPENKIPLTELAKWVAGRDPRAKAVMLKEMQERPVFVNRAPVLHKYGFMAQKPVLTAGDSIRVSPLIYAGLGADNDGDSCIATTICTLKILTYGILQDRHNAREISREVSMPKQSGSATLAVQQSKIVTCQIKDFPHLPETLEVTAGGTLLYAVPPGISVLSYNAATGESGFYPVSHFSVHPDCRGFDVTTYRGYQVGVSEDHSLYVYDRLTGELSKKTPEESIDQPVPIVRRVNRREVIATLALGKYNGDSHNLRTPMVEAITADFDMGWWIGACVSDAWSSLPAHGSIAYGKTEPALVKMFAAQAGRLVPAIEDRCHTHTANHVDTAMGLDAVSTKTTFTSAPLARLVLDWIGKNAQNKHLPDFFLSLPEDCLWGILSGLLDGDGSLAINNSAKRKTPTTACHYTTASAQLAHEIVILCQLLGVRANLAVSREIYYVVSPSLCDLYTYRDKLKLINPNKAHVLTTMPAPTHDQRDMVPIPYALADALVTLVRTKAIPGCYTEILNWKNGKKLNTRAQSLEYLAALKLHAPDHPQLAGWEKLLLDTSITWDRVKTITPIPAQVMYDLTVPETNVFAVNDGLVIWDTMNVHVPVSDDAVKEALDRMLPSKNLISTGEYDVHYLPRQEYLMGLYTATRPSLKKVPRVFATKAAAIAAYRRGEIGVRDPVEIKGE